MVVDIRVMGWRRPSRTGIAAVSVFLAATGAAGFVPATTAASPVPVAATAAPVPVAASVATPVHSARGVVACPRNLVTRLASTGTAGQLVSVEAPNDATTYATLELWQRAGSCWRPAGGPWRATIAQNGLSDHHREGDGTTPVGLFAIGPVIYGNAPNPGTQERYHRLVCGDWWDEDPTSPEYNTFQHIPCGQQPPFGADSEALWTDSVAYASFAVVDYNTHPVVPFAGSGIFIHADFGEPTQGCVALPLGDLDWLLRWLDPKRSPAVVIGYAGEITRF